MTDRLKGVWVAFERSIREDDAEAIIDAIKMVKGVLDVTPELDGGGDWINRERVRRELGEKLWEVLYPKDKS